jgi:hypothetical protein
VVQQAGWGSTLYSVAPGVAAGLLGYVVGRAVAKTIGVKSEG